MTSNLGYITSKVYNSRKTICEFLKYRSFDVSEYENDSMQDVHIMMKESALNMKISNEFKNVFVFYFIDKSLRESHIRDILDKNNIQDNDDLIIIAKDIPNATIRKIQENIYHNDNKFIIVFSLHNLQYNILEHQLVPKHKVLNNDEKNQIYELYNISNDNEMPEISRFDPVAQAIGIRPSELCEITRSSKTAIESKYYRICI